MLDSQDTLTLEELEAWLLKELARVDTSFQEGQLRARMALVRDLVPGDERIAVHPLDISELTLDFSLARGYPSWPVRLWRSLKRIAHIPSADPWSSQEGPRYRFAAHGRGDVQIHCLLRRNGTGDYRAEISSSEGGRQDA